MSRLPWLRVAAMLAATPANAAEALQAEFETHYTALGQAIQEEDLPVLVASGFRTFDGGDADVERVWKENFQSVRAYGPVTFQVRSAVDEDGDVTVEVARRIFFEFEGDESQQYEEGISRDRWRKKAGQWRLIDRDELPGKITGAISADSKPSSRRLGRLSSEIDGDAEALARFWQERQGHGPLVELIDDDVENRLVTFLWRDDAQTERVEVRGGPFENSRTPFERLPGTDVWFHAEALPKDSRYVYSLIVSRWIERPREDGSRERVLAESYPLDPLNPRTFNAGSVLELPDAPRDAWHVERIGIARGRVEHHELDSAIVSETRAVTVYTPRDFDARREECALAVFLDGEDCEQLLDLPIVFDNLVDSAEIRPTVALLVHSQGTRGRDLLFSDAFVEFLATELVPWAAEKFKLNAPASTTLIGGMSLGGLTAAYAAQQRPDVFGNVLSQSGSFWRRRPDRSPLPEGWLPGEVARRDAAPNRYYMEVGRFEAPGMVENNRRMRDVLRAKGYQVDYREYHGGHDHVNWRVSVADGLMSLLAP